MSRIVIFGRGPLAALAQTYFDADSDHTVAAFAYPGQTPGVDERSSLPLIDEAAVISLYPAKEFAMFVVPELGRPTLARHEAIRWATDAGYELVRYVSSSASVWPGTQVGRNSFILERVVVEPWVELGEDVTLWSGSHVSHASVIGNHCFVSARAVVAGEVVVEPYCYVGPNSTIRNNITIGEGSQIGPGVTVRQPTEPWTDYVATPSSRSTSER